jgi:hypothetical protein
VARESEAREPDTAAPASETEPGEPAKPVIRTTRRTRTVRTVRSAPQPADADAGTSSPNGTRDGEANSGERAPGREGAAGTSGTETSGTETSGTDAAGGGQPAPSPAPAVVTSVRRRSVRRAAGPPQGESDSGESDGAPRG